MRGETGAIVLPRLPTRFGQFALAAQPFGSAEAVVGVAVGQEPVSRGAVPFEAFGLEIRGVRSSSFRSLVPVDPEPAEPVENAGHHVGGGPLDIRILNPQDEHPVVAAGKQPIEEGRAGTADVQVAGW